MVLDTATLPDVDVSYPSYGGFTFTVLPECDPNPALTPPDFDTPSLTGELIHVGWGSHGGNPAANGFSEAGIRYFDGTLSYQTTDLSSAGFGTPWGHDRAWSNHPGSKFKSFNGSGMLVEQLPSLIQIYGTETLALVSSGTNALYFDQLVDGTYQTRFFSKEQLRHDSFFNEYILTDSTGNQLRFHDFESGFPSPQVGQLKSFTDPAGDVTLVNRATDGKVADVQRSQTLSTGDLLTESYLFAYLPGSGSAGPLQSVTLQRRLNTGPWAVVRKVEYTYCNSIEPIGGCAGDLKTALSSDGVTILDRKYYRYYKSGEADGFEHGLKYVFEPQSFARLAAAVSDPFTASDNQVAPFTDLELKYDAEQRVTEVWVQGMGSSTADGRGRFTYAYVCSTDDVDGYNRWRHKTIETRPDSKTNTVYSNFAGEVMLQEFLDADPQVARLLPVRRPGAPARARLAFGRQRLQRVGARPPGR